MFIKITNTKTRIARKTAKYMQRTPSKCPWASPKSRVIGQPAKLCIIISVCDPMYKSNVPAQS